MNEILVGENLLIQKFGDLKLRAISGFVTVVVCLYVLAVFFQLRFGFLSNSLMIFFGAVLGLTCFLYLLWRRDLKAREFYLALVFSVISLFPGGVVVSENGISIQGDGPVSGFLIISLYFAAKSIVSNGHEKGFVLGSFLFLVLSYIYYSYVYSDVFATGFFWGASYNLISSSLILMVSAYILCVGSNSKLQFFMIILTLGVSFLLYARASMVVSFIILSLWIWRNNRRFLFVLLLFLMPSVAVWGAVFEDYLFDLYLQTKFSRVGLESPRWEMWSEYLDYQGVMSVFLGADLNSVNTIKDFNGNPHNSFVRFHSLFGAPGIIFVILIFGYILTVAGAFNAGVLFLALTRAFTDVIILPGFLDIYLFVMINSIVAIKSSSRRVSKVSL